MSKPSKSLEGRRVRLVRCNDTFTEVKPGTEGVVSLVDDVGTVHVAWDTGSNLGLCWDDGDRWTIIAQ